MKRSSVGTSETKGKRKSTAIGGPTRDRKKIKQETPDGIVSSSSLSLSSSSNGTSTAFEQQQNLRTAFLSMLEKKPKGITNSSLKQAFGDQKYKKLVDVINELTQESKVTIGRSSRSGDLVYQKVADAVATKMAGLDENNRLIYQLIENSGNVGIWTKDMKQKSGLHVQTINKIIKTLEGRRLIKAVKAVHSKNKNLYMLYDLKPAEEITGGPWYTDQHFDHEFIAGLRHFIMLCVKKMNGGKGVSLSQISEKMVQANVSRVPLELDKVQQLVQTLAFDYMIQQNGVNPNTGEALFVAARPISSYCGFKFWDSGILSPDFHFRRIVFEDGVVLECHEPHHQS